MEHTHHSFDSDASQDRGDATRQALIEAGLQLFGRLGYHATSSRALAEAAGVNQALINYHFGGKRGLYVAVFQHIVDRMRHQVGPAIEALRKDLPRLMEEGDRQALLGVLLSLVDRYIDQFTSPETADWATLIVREQQDPSEAFELVWEGMMKPTLTLMTQLVTCLIGEPSPEESPASQRARFLALGIMGQVLFFRVAPTAAIRQLGWQEIGAAEVEDIKHHIRRNIHSMLSEEDR